MFSSRWTSKSWARLKHTGYQVRRIEEADASDVVAVWRSTWTATYEATLGPAALGEMLRHLDENGTVGMIPSTAQGLCLVHEGRIVGTAVHSKDGPNVYLWGMYVMPKYQRAGAGGLMLQAVREAAGNRPVEVRVLNSSAHANSFYLKHGFQAVGSEQTEIMAAVTEACSVMRQIV